MNKHRKEIEKCFAVLREAKRGNGNDPERMENVTRAEQALKALFRKPKPTQREITRLVGEATKALVKALFRVTPI